MKKLFIIFAMVVSSGFVSYAKAEDVLPRNEFNYQFNFEFRDGVISNVDYNIVTGDISQESGDWTITINNPRTEAVADYNFDPAISAGVFIVPVSDNGTEAIFTNPQGVQVARVWLAGSRVCDDNGACERDSGEDEQNCPADCSVVDTASITQSGMARVGGALLHIGLALAGVFILVAVTRSLDSRRRV